MNTDGPLFHKHMQILASEPRCRRGDGAFIVRAVPENAISGKIKWERWSERKISIFYEHFPLLPLSFLWLSASIRIPSSLIPFSKNVIKKNPLDFLFPHSLPVWARQHSLTSSTSTSASVSLQSGSPLLVGALRKNHLCAVHSCCGWLPVCLCLCRLGCIFISRWFVCEESQPCSLFCLAILLHIHAVTRSASSELTSA